MNEGKNCEKTYRSAVDRMFILSILLFIVMYFILLFCGLVLESLLIFVIGSAICLPAIIAIILLCFKTEYTISIEELTIRSPGSRKESVLLKDIKFVRKVNCMISAKALSTERIEITTVNRARIYISPVDRDEFLDTLNERRERLQR